MEITEIKNLIEKNKKSVMIVLLVIISLFFLSNRTKKITFETYIPEIMSEQQVILKVKKNEVKSMQMSIKMEYEQDSEYYFEHYITLVTHGLEQSGFIPDVNVKKNKAIITTNTIKGIEIDSNLGYSDYKKVKELLEMEGYKKR